MADSHLPGKCEVCQQRTHRRSTVRCRKCADAAARGGGVRKGMATQSIDASGQTAELSRITPIQVRTLADLISVCEIDTSEWDVERWVANKWEVGAKNNDGELVTAPLFQVKAWLKRKVAAVAARAEIAAMFEDAGKRMPPRPFVARKRQASGYLLEIAIPDLHLGKLAWSAETGHANYDSKIAQRCFREALEALVQRTASFTFDRVVLVVGNDFLHSNSPKGQTYAGTQLDSDSRWHKTYMAGRRLLCQSIERLRTIAPVTVISCPGNHDTTASWCLADAIECYFKNTADVDVRNEPTARKYYRHGRVMLMWTHGNAGKLKNLPLLMATEQPEMFGATSHREAHTGDKHQTRVEETMGVKVRISPALCPPDAWHAEMQFVNQARAAEAFVWHQDEGLVSIATYTIDPESWKREATA